MKRKTISVHDFPQLPLEKPKADQDDILPDRPGSTNMTTVARTDLFLFSSFVLSLVPT